MFSGVMPGPTGTHSHGQGTQMIQNVLLIGHIYSLSQLHITLRPYLKSFRKYVLLLLNTPRPVRQSKPFHYIIAEEILPVCCMHL